MDTPQLSVIIPVAPGDDAWRGLLQQLPPDWDIIISATSRCPESRSLPDTFRWQAGPAGRGRQLNAGASLSRARWLWFIHADSRLASNACSQVSAWCGGRRRGLGYLDLRFLNDGPWLTRLNALGANLRSRWLGLPYGDQGLCIAAEQFQALGGFREDLERGEDLDLVVRARLSGLRAERIRAGIRTSARRYRDQGWLNTTWRHQINAIRLIRQARRS